uniref:BLUF domain-containing protein n=1 Tax=Mucilaginibacter sp. Bleaf8 TaxID=2834430 RepID=UPI0024BECBF1|nr:BLUF domain-containing protein [Mucilaginibacter sp. Bleaf8]
MLFCVIYISKAVKLMSESELQQLLNESRSWNESHELTGMLLYIEGRFLLNLEGRFMQVLEGPEEEVKSTFNKIKTDSRHHQLIVFKHQPITKRNFTTWTMGFKSIELDEYQNTPGFFELDDDFLNSNDFQESGTALTFLKTFYSINKEQNFQ